jgi:pimeloyl-ACP methyl ester carboxylesterase
VGARAAGTQWEQHGAYMAKAVPHASVQMIENGGHFLHLQRPQETADAIVAFLQAAL